MYTYDMNHAEWHDGDHNDTPWNGSIHPPEQEQTPRRISGYEPIYPLARTRPARFEIDLCNGGIDLADCHPDVLEERLSRH